MFWKNERGAYGHIVKEKVQMYECAFSTTTEHNGKKFNGDMRVLVVCNTVEDAIAACRRQWPEGFVLHQIVKRNQRCELIIDDSAMGLAEESNG